MTGGVLVYDLASGFLVARPGEKPLVILRRPLDVGGEPLESVTSYLRYLAECLERMGEAPAKIEESKPSAEVTSSHVLVPSGEG